MKKIFLTFALILISASSFAQNDTVKSKELKSVSIVSSYRVKSDNGSLVTKEKIEEENNGKEPVFIFAKMPSIFAYGDNGSEFGYGYMRIRGLDQTDAISIAINAIEKVSKLGHSEVTKISDKEISMEIDHLFKENGWSCLEEVDVDLVARHFVNWQNEQVRIRAYCWLKNQPRFCVTDDFIKEFCDYITDVETKKGGDDVQKR